MLTSFVTGTGKAFPKLNTLNCAFFFFSPPLPVLFSNLKPLNCLSLYHQLILAADKRDLVDLKSGDKIVNIDNTYVLQWPVTYKNLRASKVGGPRGTALQGPREGRGVGCSGHGASMPGGVVGWGGGVSGHGTSRPGGGGGGSRGTARRDSGVVGWGGLGARRLEAWGWGWGFSRHGASRLGGEGGGSRGTVPRGPGLGGVGGLGARCLEAWGWVG
ncbi:hypothetical protein KY284_036662 [Solanum tuberosum]|nr:hypothetical protein KY284_036662 [Solanum tuberosum]